MRDHSRRLSLAPRIGAGLFAIPLAALAAALALASPRVARADNPPRANANPPAMSGPMFVRSTEAVDAAAAGRSLMAKGDCTRAIVQFDIALRTSQDPTVRRDRGICHEKLDHPFPAIDDYRAYLFHMPESPDSDSIRERLAALEDASKNDDSKTEGVLAPDWSAQAGIMDSPGLRGSGGGSSRPPPPKPPKREKDSVEKLEDSESLDDAALHSPLRRGTGFVIGPYFQYRSWGISGTPIGQGYGVGASLRQSLGSFSTILLELGFAGYATNAGQATSASLGVLQLGEQRSGFDMTLAYEGRIRLDSRASNQITIALGCELTDLIYAQSKDSFFGLLARGRLGYRHIFGPSLGVEVAFDAAQPFYGTGSAVSAAFGQSTLWQTTIVGGYAGLMLGF